MWPAAPPGAARCCHAGHDRFRVVPTRHQRGRALGRPGRRAPGRPGTPGAGDRAGAGVRHGTGGGAAAVSGGAGAVGADARVPDVPARAAQPAHRRGTAGTRYRGGAPGEPVLPRCPRKCGGATALPAAPCRLPDGHPGVRGGVPDARHRRGGGLAVAARHPQRRRPYPGTVDGVRDRAARARHRAGLAVAAGRGHRAVRPAAPQRRGTPRARPGRRGSRRLRRSARRGEAGGPAGPDRRDPRGAAAGRRWRAGRGGTAQSVARCGVPRSPAGRAARPAVREPGRVRP